MVFSCILYLGTLGCCLLLSHGAVRHQRKGFVWIQVLLLTLLAGLRGETVGIDTASYLEKFQLLAAGDFAGAYGLEFSFKAVCFLVLKFVPSNTFLLLLFAFLTHGLILWRFWDYRQVSSYPWMVFCYYLGFFFMSLNCMRQFCAIAMVFYASRYLERRRLMAFVFGVLLAAVFHGTAVVGLVLLVFGFFSWKELSNLQRIFFLDVLLLSPLFFLYAQQVYARYARYFSQPQVEIGRMLPVKLLFLAGTLLLVVAGRREGRSPETARTSKLLLPVLCYGLGLCLALLGYFYPYMERISWYFYLFEGVYFGALLKERRPLQQLVCGYGVVLFLGYEFVQSMLHNAQGTMPYLFFWQ